jgi:hypothetical protein
MLLPMIQSASESSPDLLTHGYETNPAIPAMFLCMQGQAIAVRTFLRLLDGGPCLQDKRGSNDLCSQFGSPRVVGGNFRVADDPRVARQSNLDGAVALSNR